MKKIFNNPSPIIIAVLLLLNVFLFIQNKDDSSSNTALISQSDLKDEAINPAKYAYIMPVEPGTKWIYEGKRIWYDRELDPGLVGKAQETTGQKIIEVENIKTEDDNLRVFISISYINNPDDFSKFEKSFLLSESGYAFDGNNISYLPLAKGQRLSPNASDFERDDDYYVSYVSSVNIRDVLGEQRRCYDIVYYTLPDDSLDVFCEGVGYIRNSYTHHGTPDEWDYNLVRIEHPVLKK